ncbi:MAG: hypothetical protein AMXMBFR53_19850 [Gemmatimonadota bacterium]
MKSRGSNGTSRRVTPTPNADIKISLRTPCRCIELTILGMLWAINPTD